MSDAAAAAASDKGAAAAASPEKEFPGSSEKPKSGAEVVSVELPAPAGWRKKFTPKKGGTPRRNEILFISPTDEEIKSKRQLEQYLKSHPGGPPSSEFDWGTGDTPRRSARISGKAKATESPEGEPPKKRERKSSSKKGGKEKKESGDEKDEPPAEEDVLEAEETEGADVEMHEADDVANKTEGEAASRDVGADEDTAGQTPIDQIGKNEEKTEEMIIGKENNLGKLGDVLPARNEGEVKKSQPEENVEEENESETEKTEEGDKSLAEKSEEQDNPLAEEAKSRAEGNAGEEDNSKTEKVDGKEMPPTMEKMDGDNKPQSEQTEEENKSKLEKVEEQKEKVEEQKLGPSQAEKEIKPGELIPENGTHNGTHEDAQ